MGLPDQKAEIRTIQDLENSLRWRETLWISNKRAIKGTVVAFHNTAEVDNTRVPCFMLPSLPQLSTDYIGMGKMMDPKQPFFAVYLPSEKRNPECTSSVYRLARYYADEIDKFQPAGPLAIGGWSAGGIIARLTAQLLQESGRDVPLLVVIDGALPTVDAGDRNLFEKIQVSCCRILNVFRNLIELRRDIMLKVRRRPTQHADLGSAIKSAWQASSLKLNWERAVDPIATKLGVRKPTQEGPARHAAENASNISGLPADHRACAIALYDAIYAYVPHEKYSGKVVLYEATAEPDRSSERVARKWSKISTDLTVVPVEGHHMSIVKPASGIPLVRDLCTRLKELGNVGTRELDLEPERVALRRRATSR